MNYDEFINSLDGPRPPALPDVLTALWWDKKGDRDAAHNLTQNISMALQKEAFP